MMTDVRTRQTLHVGQATHRVATGKDVMLSTVLGSCIATCLHDPGLMVGGMNHILLPPGAGRRSGGELISLHLMELLVNALMKLGSRKQNLQAKIFGGANVIVEGSTVGARNIEFAQTFLRDEGIPCIAESLGGTRARLVRFWPASGRASLLVLAPTDARIDILATTRTTVPAPGSDADELWD